MSYVLIVDDDVTMAETVASMVSLFDWDSQIVHHPRAAIQSIHNNPPSLILLDLNMPGVDGIEVCKYIKRDPVSMNIPVVFITAEDSPSIIQKAKDAGASDFLIKPVDVDRIEGMLARLAKK
jgi:CheY-like chemotaxis protein